MDRLKITCIIATIFFSIGTMLLLLQLYFKNMMEITVLGYYYVYFSVIINIIVLGALFVILLFRNDKIKTLKAIGVLLINIPIALLYFQIIMKII
ncbi:hypothetical protein [Psychroserpens damuponensis]|uniref:hypothetical protein n=1 Tax=Psychroserpens damuponensis TaxID=943936 RepID=UPI00058D1B35|nr:hypothetical protein [Psychroserpens damuponensis]